MNNLETPCLKSLHEFGITDYGIELRESFIEREDILSGMTQRVTPAVRQEK